MDNPRTKFYVDNNSFWAHSAVVLLALATVFQFIACWGLWNDRVYALTQILLPVASFFLFVLLLSLLGNKALWVTILPFLGGIAFYGLQAWFVEDRIVMMIGIAYCVLATVLYVGTVLSLIRARWLLVLLFAVPFLYRAFYRDVLILQNVEQPATFASGMREISLLCVLLAMTLLALGIRKRSRDRKGKEAPLSPPPTSASSASGSSSAPLPFPSTSQGPASDAPMPENNPTFMTSDSSPDDNSL